LFSLAPLIYELMGKQKRVSYLFGHPLFYAHIVLVCHKVIPMEQRGLWRKAIVSLTLYPTLKNVALLHPCYKRGRLY